MSYPAVTHISSARKGRVRDLDVTHAAEVAELGDDAEAAALLRRIEACKRSINPDMTRLATLSARYDNLYYPDEITQHGADHHPEDRVGGRNHISLNTYPAYVDVPAALLSVPPIENMQPSDATSPEAKEIAALAERLYFSWKDREKMELKYHKGSVAKGIYGRAAAKVYWETDKEYPCVSIIDQPRNLWLGWSSTEYDRLDWAVYVYRITPDAVLSEWGLDVDVVDGRDGERYPRVRPIPGDTGTWMTTPRSWNSNVVTGMIEVHDYWYRKVAKGVTPRPGKKPRMETWNAILVGNWLVKDSRHTEYDGRLPYVPVFNTYIPGTPEGRSYFFDIEPLLREKEQRLEAGGTMIQKSVSGQYWQLFGPDAPDRVPVGLKPKPDTVVAPGAGNRIEKIEPYTPEFQLEQYLDRIDRELVDASGLNDLLRGLAPAAVLSSSKAVNALVANYEARMAMSRQLFYDFRTEVWELAKVVWGRKVSELKAIFEVAGKLVIKNPSLTPRDDAEVAQMAMGLVQSRIWSQVRAMDMTGVEDPQAEQQDIREESTDASLFPDRVQTMAALIATFQQMGVDPAALGGQQSPQAMGDAAAAARMAANPNVGGTPMLNDPNAVPPNPNQPANAQDAALAGLIGGGIQSGPGFNSVSQTQIKGGDVSNRILLQQPIGPPPAGG